MESRPRQLHDLQLDLVAPGARLRRYRTAVLHAHFPPPGLSRSRGPDHDILVCRIHRAGCARRRPRVPRKHRVRRCQGRCCNWILLVVCASPAPLDSAFHPLLGWYTSTPANCCNRAIFVFLVVLDAMESLRSRGHTTHTTTPAAYPGV